MKIDMHLHSKLSKRPSQWVLQKIGCPESFTDPEQLYRITRKAGMSAMTLTDHNTIDGCLDIAHLPNTFISEEVTSYFPDDGCKAHVLVYDIDETIHQDIQELRENIYHLVSYLNEKGIAHALAHPLFSINDRLTLERFEQFLLLFRTFELNGARDEAQNILIRLIMENLSRETLEHLMDKHGIEPPRDRFWGKKPGGWLGRSQFPQCGPDVHTGCGSKRPVRVPPRHWHGQMPAGGLRFHPQDPRPEHVRNRISVFFQTRQFHQIRVQGRFDQVPR